MRQATEALARNASYRPRARPLEPPPQRTPGRGQAAQATSPPQGRVPAHTNGSAVAAPPPPPATNGALAAQQAQVAAVQQQAASAAARHATPRGIVSAVPARSADREGAARTVIRAVTLQQNTEQADAAAERRNSEAARVTDLQLAQQQAQARKLAEAQASLGQTGGGAKRYILQPGAGVALPGGDGGAPTQTHADAVARAPVKGAEPAQANGRPAAAAQE